MTQQPEVPGPATPQNTPPRTLQPVAGPLLQAHALFAGRTWVGIEHNGQQYRLQATRAGKLILTK